LFREFKKLTTDESTSSAQEESTDNQQPSLDASTTTTTSSNTTSEKNSQITSQTKTDKNLFEIFQGEKDSEGQSVTPEVTQPDSTTSIQDNKK
jgi:hypothetical protein